MRPPAVADVTRPVPEASPRRGYGGLVPRPARPTPRPRGARTGLPAVGLAAAVALGAAGCSSAVPVDVAPYATDPVCAEIVLDLPDVIAGDLEQQDTTSQATTAWGDPAHPVVLRCGVEPLGPTTDKCQTVETPGGPSVDWVIVPDDPDDEAGSDWTFTTYGRVPAVEIHVPAEVRRTHATTFLDAFGPAVRHAEQQRTCL